MSGVTGSGLPSSKRRSRIACLWAWTSDASLSDDACSRNRSSLTQAASRCALSSTAAPQSSGVLTELFGGARDGTELLIATKGVQAVQVGRVWRLGERG